MWTPAGVRFSGKAAMSGVSDVSEGIMKSQAGRIVMASAMNSRYASGCFNFGTPGIFPSTDTLMHGDYHNLT